MGDFNENMIGTVIKEWRESMQVRDILIDRVGEDNMPATWHLGIDPIDTMICTRNVVIKKQNICHSE